jgi:hypothetical protein
MRDERKGRSLRTGFFHFFSFLSLDRSAVSDRGSRCPVTRPDYGVQSKVRAQYAALIFHTVNENALRTRFPEASITRSVGYQVPWVVAIPVMAPAA